VVNERYLKSTLHGAYTGCLSFNCGRRQRRRGWAQRVPRRRSRRRPPGPLRLDTRQSASRLRASEARGNIDGPPAVEGNQKVEHGLLNFWVGD
jgi:hypothetical protein